MPVHDLLIGRRQNDGVSVTRGQIGIEHVFLEAMALGADVFAQTA
jgi:hypothetical protein